MVYIPIQYKYPTSIVMESPSLSNDNGHFTNSPMLKIIQNIHSKDILTLIILIETSSYGSIRFTVRYSCIQLIYIIFCNY